MEQNKCIECGAYNGHSPTCSLMDENYAKSELKRYYTAWLEKDTENRKVCALYNKIAQEKLKRIRDERDRWMGKFMAVKNENNKLRNRLLSPIRKECINRTGDANFECFEKGKCKNCSE